MALVCEYYLKAIIMRETSINNYLSTEMKNILSSEVGRDCLTEDEEIALIKDDAKSITILLEKDPESYKGLIALKNKRVFVNGKQKPAIKVLQEQLKNNGITFHGISHDINLAINKIPIKYRDAIFNFLKKYELIDIPKTSADFDYSIYSLYDVILKDKLSSSRVKDAFPNGRYGAIHTSDIDLYKADFNTLFELIHAIQYSICINIPNAILINGSQFIFPDENSNIEVFDESHNSIGKINYNKSEIRFSYTDLNEVSESLSLYKPKNIAILSTGKCHVVYTQKDINKEILVRWNS